MIRLNYKTRLVINPSARRQEYAVEAIISAKERGSLTLLVLKGFDTASEAVEAAKSRVGQILLDLGACSLSEREIEFRQPSRQTRGGPEDLILAAVALEYGVDGAGILAGNRQIRFVVPRRVIMVLLDQVLGWTHEVIGEFLGMERTTVTKGIGRVLDYPSDRDSGVIRRVTALVQKDMREAC